MARKALFNRPQDSSETSSKFSTTENSKFIIDLNLTNRNKMHVDSNPFKQSVMRPPKFEVHNTKTIQAKENPNQQNAKKTAPKAEKSN